ncbi:hypothetical protein L227DRAFT_614108 [Lentinus tigrinus ALCF2SS1-6]|uniref:Uncharacterized protein n=1 Tax=Lentinus tigrinus ALCF2SS1-6 TaxID=1328759 RepID=A0A5C2S0P6_9APHY|nr:hypothetical protein L227DRAFT_614108 [Lentinus tigrinus ALCF2SS1-6]
MVHRALNRRRQPPPLVGSPPKDAENCFAFVKAKSVGRLVARQDDMRQVLQDWSFQGNLLILARIFSKAGSGRGVIKLKDLSSSLTATGCEMQRGKGRMTRLLPPPELAKAAVTFSAPSNGDVSKATQAFIRRQIVAKWGVGFEFFAARL